MHYLQGSWQEELENRIADIEGDEPTTLSARMAALELNSPRPAIANVNTSTSGLTVDVLGIQVMAGSSTKAMLSSIAMTMNAMLSAMREKKVIMQ